MNWHHYDCPARHPLNERDCTCTQPGRRYDTPGREGSLGPGPTQYGLPHVYARDTQSGAGNCVCGAHLGDSRHVQAAPGVPVPDWARS